MKTIGIVEDDKLLNEALAIALRKEGYQVLCGASCKEGSRIIKKEPDLLLVDIGLPDGNGITLCREAEGYGGIPVIFLTAKDEEVDMLKAFDAGCDDYVVKPFPLSVLKRRIQAVLRRSTREAECFTYKNLKIDFDKMQVSYLGREISLTAKEYQLLEMLVRNQGRVVPKELILERLWDIDGKFVVENTVSVTVNRLRKKIEPDITTPVFIKNVFGVGYTFGE